LQRQINERRAAGETESKQTKTSKLKSKSKSNSPNDDDDDEFIEELPDNFMAQLAALKAYEVGSAIMCHSFCIFLLAAP
jgi:hypothetical protein